MEYVTREQAGLIPATSISRISSSQGMAVHWSAGPTSQTPREIQRYHMEVRGWTDIAYSWLVDDAGVIYEGRGWGRAGGHTLGFNSVCHAVCFIGTEDSQVSARAIDAINEVIAEHDARYGAGYVRPHRDFPGAATACPGDLLARFARTYEPGEDGMSQADLDQIAGWEQDTRRIILAGQVRAEEMHAASLRAEWRTRTLVKQVLGEVTDTEEDAALIEAAKASEYIANEGRRQVAEIDGVPLSELVL